MGYEFPMTLCLNIEYTSTTEYNGVDPNTNNNTKCVEVIYDNKIAENANNLNVYPNPACNEIHVDNVAGAQISIYNIAGQEVMSIENADANATINVSNLTEGPSSGNSLPARKYHSSLAWIKWIPCSA